MADRRQRCFWAIGIVLRWTGAQLGEAEVSIAQEKRGVEPTPALDRTAAPSGHLADCSGWCSAVLCICRLLPSSSHLVSVLATGCSLVLWARDWRAAGVEAWRRGFHLGSVATPHHLTAALPARGSASAAMLGTQFAG